MRSFATSKPTIAELFSAAESGNLKPIEEYVRAGGDVDVRGEKFETFLCAAAFHGQFHICEFLLENGANATVVNEGGQTVLHLIAFNEKVESVKEAEVVALLVQRGANVNARDCNGCTPLIMAAAMTKRVICAELLNQGADVKAVTNILKVADGDQQQDHQSGITALHAALYSEGKLSQSIMLLLMDSGADLFLEDGNGNTPFDLAESKKCKYLKMFTEVAEMVRKLMKPEKELLPDLPEDVEQDWNRAALERKLMNNPKCFVAKGRLMQRPIINCKTGLSRDSSELDKDNHENFALKKAIRFYAKYTLVRCLEVAEDLLVVEGSDLRPLIARVQELRSVAGKEYDEWIEWIMGQMETAQEGRIKKTSEELDQEEADHLIARTRMLCDEGKEIFNDPFCAHLIKFPAIAENGSTGSLRNFVAQLVPVFAIDHHFRAAIELYKDEVVELYQLCEEFLDRKPLAVEVISCIAQLDEIINGRAPQAIVRHPSATGSVAAAAQFL